jgi:hypothetical protein
MMDDQKKQCPARLGKLIEILMDASLLCSLLVFCNFPKLVWVLRVTQICFLIAFFLSVQSLTNHIDHRLILFIHPILLHFSKQL